MNYWVACEPQQACSAGVPVNVKGGADVPQCTRVEKWYYYCRAELNEQTYSICQIPLFLSQQLGWTVGESWVIAL